MYASLPGRGHAVGDHAADCEPGNGGYQRRGAAALRMAAHYDTDSVGVIDVVPVPCGADSSVPNTNVPAVMAVQKPM